MKDPLKRLRAIEKRLEVVRASVTAFTTVSRPSYFERRETELVTAITKLGKQLRELQSDREKAPAAIDAGRAEIRKLSAQRSGLRTKPKVQRLLRLAAQVAELRAELEKDGVELEDYPWVTRIGSPKPDPSPMTGPEDRRQDHE